MKRLILLCSAIGAAIGIFVAFSEKQPEAQFVEIAETPFRAAYLVPDPDATDARAYLIVQSGEIDNDGPNGLAHYVEHLAWLSAFQDPNNRADRHANAWTNSVATVYWESFAPSELSRAIARLKGVLDTPDLDPAFAIEERDIVMREYDLRQTGDPYLEVTTDIEQTMFPASPYGRSVIGTPASIETFTVEAALDLHARTHVADNSVLVVQGDFSPRQMKQALGGGHLGTAPTAAAPLPPLEYTPLRDVKSAQIDIASPVLLYQTLVKSPDCGTIGTCDAAMVLLEDALDSALDGGIAGPLRFDNFLARSFDIGVYRIGNDGIWLGFRAETDRGVTPDELLTAFEDVLANTQIPDATFETVQERWLADFDGDLNVSDSMLDSLISQITYREAPDDLHQARADIADVDFATSRALLDAIRGDGRTVIRLLNPQPE